MKAPAYPTSHVALLSSIILALALFQPVHAGSLIATLNPFTISNTVLPVGTYTVASTAISGGAGPYKGEWTLISSNAPPIVINTIIAGPAPNWAAFNPSGTLVYVTNYNSNPVNVIDPTTNTVINTINTGNPVYVAFNPSGTLVYVTDNNGGVNVIDPTTNTIIKTIDVSNTLYGVAFNPSGTLAYVVNHGGDAVNVIDPTTNTVINTILLGAGAQPEEVAFNPSGTLAYVSSATAVNVIDVSTNTVINTIAPFDLPYGIAFNPAGTLAYVTNFNTDTVNVIDVSTNTIVNTIIAGSSPTDIAMNPSGTLAYVTEYNSGTVNVIDVSTNTIINTIAVGSSPWGITFNPSGTIVYVSNYGGTDVNVIDPKETAIQALPSTNALSLTVSAASSNTLSLTFNGVQYSISTGDSTVYGQWKLFGFARDSTTGPGHRGTNTVVMSNTFTIDPAPTLTLTITAPNSILVNSMAYGTSGTLSANAVASGGTGTFTFGWLFNGADSSNTLIGSTASYSTVNALTISGGSHTFAVNAFDTGFTSPYRIGTTNVLVVAKNSVLTATCTSPGSVGFYTWATVTCTGTQTINNQSAWGLYVDGTLNNETASSASWTEQTQSGSHTILFKNPGNSNYTNYTGSAALTVYGLGTGGGGGVSGSTTVHTTTTTSSTPTTSQTTAPTTTIPQVTTQNRSATVSVSSRSPITVYFNSLNVHVTLLSNSTSSAAAFISVSDATMESPSPPMNMTKLSAYNITVNSSSVESVVAELPYDCSLDTGALGPYILKNGTWVQITQFSLDSSACTMAVTVPKDPIVAIMQRQAVPVTSTIPVSGGVRPSSPSSAYGFAVALVAVIVVLVVIALLLRSRQRSSGWPRP